MNKKDAVTQITIKYCREACLSDSRATGVDYQLDTEELEMVVQELHYHISHSWNSPVKIRNFLHHNPEDPAKKVGFPYFEARIKPNYKL